MTYTLNGEIERLEDEITKLDPSFEPCDIEQAFNDADTLWELGAHGEAVDLYKLLSELKSLTEAKKAVEAMKSKIKPVKIAGIEGYLEDDAGKIEAYDEILGRAKDGGNNEKN